MTPRSKALVHLDPFLESEAPLRWLTDHCRPATFEHFLVIQDTRIPYHGMPLLDGPVFGHWADGQPDVHAEVPQLIPQEVLNYLESVAQELHHREALAEGGHQPDAANEDAAGAGDNLDARPSACSIRLPAQDRLLPNRPSRPFRPRAPLRSTRGGRETLHPRRPGSMGPTRHQPRRDPKR